MSKKIIFLLLSVISLSTVLLSSCKKEEASGEVKMVGFYITPRTTFAEVGATQDITVWASYTDGSKINMTDSVQITSSAPSIVSVKDGVATGLSEGKAILTATYLDRMDTCSFTVSAITEIKLSIDGENEALLAFPEDEFSADKIVVKAFFKSGDSTIVTPDTLYSYDEENFKVSYKDGKLEGLKIARVQNEATTLTAEYTGANEKTYTSTIEAVIGKVDDVILSIAATELKDKMDTLKLGETSSVVAEGAFSWEGYPNRDTVDVLSLVADSIESDNTAILGINVEDEAVSVVANDTTESGKTITFSATFFGKEYRSREIAIVTDSTYEEPNYQVEIFTDYAYTGDIVTYKFLEGFKDNETVIDLTNTGNKNISSALAKGTEKPTTFVVSSGVLSVPATYTETSEKDSLKVYVKYEKNGQELITNSNGIVLYDNPSLEFNADNNIRINGGATSLHFDECTIVDNTGKDWTDKIDKTSLVLKVDPEMNGRTLIMTYGPEKRTASVYIDAQ